MERCHGDHGYCHGPLLICTGVVDSSNGEDDASFLPHVSCEKKKEEESMKIVFLRNSSGRGNARGIFEIHARYFFSRCIDYSRSRKKKKGEKGHNRESVHVRRSVERPSVEATLYLAPPLANPTFCEPPSTKRCRAHVR